MEKGEGVVAVKESESYLLMDALDDELILAELEGRALDKWAYRFQGADGKEVSGLSKVGVDMAGREMAKRGEAIREEDVEWQPDPTDARFVLFKAFASRVSYKDGQKVELDRCTGTKRQCLFIVNNKDGITDKPNPFWYEQGSMKALRNAKSRLVPEEIVAVILAQAKLAGKVKDVKGKAERKPVPEPQATKDTATENQINAIKARLDKMGLTSDDDKASWLTKKGYPALASIPKAKASELITLIDNGQV